DPDQQPVRLADQTERDRGERAHERDQDQLTPHEGPELLVDERPRVPYGLALRARKQARDEIDGPVSLEDPVRRDREREQDPDEHLDGLLADRQRRTD